MTVKIELNHKLHVLTRKEELDSVRIAGKVVVVIDILFATTTMVAALAHGAREVIPVLDEAAARAEDQRRGAGASVLAGELYAETLPGFVHPAPLALVAHGVKTAPSSIRRPTARSRCRSPRAPSASIAAHC